MGYNKKIKGLAMAGITTGISSSMVSAVGGDATPIKNASAALPMVGTIAGAGVVLGAAKKLKTKI